MQALSDERNENLEVMNHKLWSIAIGNVAGTYDGYILSVGTDPGLINLVSILLLEKLLIF